MEITTNKVINDREDRNMFVTGCMKKFGVI